MAARSDNSIVKNLSSLLPHIGEGVVIDIGTGDGRFVSAVAKENPNKFFIGIDPNVKPLEKPSMKATRKPGKGGLPNALFVQAAIEDLPKELTGVADEIHIHFPWASLLRAVVIGDEAVLASLRRISAPGCLLEIIIGIDPDRDRAEVERLGLPQITQNYLRTELAARFALAGFDTVEIGSMDPGQWAKLETSWARKLQGSATRDVLFAIFRASH